MAPIKVSSQLICFSKEAHRTWLVTVWVFWSGSRVFPVLPPLQQRAQNDKAGIHGGKIWCFYENRSFMLLKLNTDRHHEYEIKVYINLDCPFFSTICPHFLIWSQEVLRHQSWWFISCVCENGSGIFHLAVMCSIWATQTGAEVRWEKTSFQVSAFHQSVDWVPAQILL